MKYWHSCKEAGCFQPVVTTSEEKIACRRCVEHPIVAPDLFTKKIDPNLFTNAGSWSKTTIKGAAIITNGYWVRYDAEGRVLDESGRVTNFTLNNE